MKLLTKDSGKQLLKIARETVEKFLLEGKIPDFEIKDPLLFQNFGVFVTIKKQEKLRGCIGTFFAKEPLFKLVQKMALAAAFEDSRFLPVQKEELKDLKYEISILGPLKKIDDWKKIKLGKEGVLIEYQGKSGVFLPQVAKEFNLNLKEFLELLCKEKVGVESDCYQKREAKIFVFEVQVFSENGS